VVPDQDGNDRARRRRVRRCGRADCHSRVAQQSRDPVDVDVRGTAGINERATGAQQHSAHSDQRAPATGASSPAAPSDRGSRLGTGGLTALLDTLRLTAVGEAGGRGHANACDPDTDQCGATAATIDPKQQLGQTWGQPQGFSLWRLVLTSNPAATSIRS
jgi:hypothetical protein